MQTKKMMFVITFLSMLFLITGCSLFSPVKGPDNTFLIRTVPCPHEKWPGRPINLLVLPTGSNSIYNTTDMAYSTSCYQLSFYAKNGWAAPPARMMQPLLVETLQRTHYFHVVDSAPISASYDYVLSTQLIELRQVFCGCHSEVHLKVSAQLTNTATNRVIASREFEVIEPAAPNPCGGVIAANRAMAYVLIQIANFCLRKL